MRCSFYKKEDGKETSFEVEVRSALIAGDFDKTRQTVNTWPTYSVPLRKARSNARWFVGFNRGLTDFWIFEMILVKRSPVILKLARQRLLGSSNARILKTAAAQQGLMQIVRDFCEHSNAICGDCRFPELVESFKLQFAG